MLSRKVPYTLTLARRARVERQIALIDRMSAHGHETASAESVLATMQISARKAGPVYPRSGRLRAPGQPSGDALALM